MSPPPLRNTTPPMVGRQRNRLDANISSVGISSWSSQDYADGKANNRSSDLDHLPEVLFEAYLHLGRLSLRSWRNTTVDGSFSSVTIRNLLEDSRPFAGLSPARLLSGPIACTIPAPSGLVFKTARGSRFPNGAWSKSAKYN